MPCRAQHTAEPIAAAAAPTLTPTSPPPDTSAAAACLLDVNSGTLLVAHNADAPMPMASTTKVMTALVVIDLLPLDREITVPPEAVGIEGSSIYLFAGERITVETLLFALLLSSANDAATALAIAAAGSVDAFAARMNEKAADMGLTGTHFVNPHGLYHEEHRTTARDLARIMAAALTDPVLSRIMGTVRHQAPQNGTDATRLFLNHNRLLKSYPHCIGGKTGFTKASGRCLVSAARQGALTLVAVTLRDGNDWRDHAALFDWGFGHFTALAPDTAPITLAVVGGMAPTVTVTPAPHAAITLPADHAPIRCVVELPRFLYAGVKEGERVGQMLYFCGDDCILTLPLCTENGVDINTPRRTLWQRIKALF